MPTKIGPYQVVGALGKGGMAELFLGRRVGPQGFARSVAIKRILPHLAEDQNFVTMFLDEARIAAEIQHPNVVSVEELNHDGDGLYMVMEYLAGESLAAVMHRLEVKKKQIDPEVAAHIMAQACAGLHAAHTLTSNAGEKRSIVHRDISPQNLFVTYDGTVKVLDFGIAHAANRLTKTESGSLKGKLSYLSPEQLQNHDLDQRSDIFALGIVLHELLTLKRLFKSDNPGATVRAVLHKQVPPPSATRPELPRELDAICLKALSRAFHARYEWAADMRRDLLRLPRRGHEALPEERLKALMDELFGERAAAKRRVVQRVEDGQSISIVIGDETLGIGASTADGDASLVRPTGAGEAKRHWRWGAAALAVGALIAAGAWVWPSDDAAPMNPAAVTTEVHISIASVPPGAAVTGIGDAVLTTPGVLDLPRGDGPRVLRFELAGHEPWTEEIIPDVDQRLRVTLVPLEESDDDEGVDDPTETQEPQEPQEAQEPREPESAMETVPRRTPRRGRRTPRMDPSAPDMGSRFEIWE